MLGVAHDLGWWLIGKPMVDFLFALIELILLPITFPMRQNSYSSAVFTEGRPLYIQILPGQSRPQQPFFAENTNNASMVKRLSS